MNLRDQRRWKVTTPNGYDQIVGKRGTIDQYQDGDLNIWITNTRVALHSGWKPLHTYDDGADFCRKIDDLDTACKLIKARKRRRVTEAMRQRGRELIARMRSSKTNPPLGCGLTNDLPASDTQLPPGGPECD